MILLLDTSTGECRLTLVDDQPHSYTWQADRGLAKGLLAYIRDRLDDRQATLQDLTGIGVMRGPGSFTGLRIGMTVLNTLASELGIPIVGTVGPTWRDEALARLQRGESDQVVLPEYGAEAHITKPKK